MLTPSSAKHWGRRLLRSDPDLARVGIVAQIQLAGRDDTSSKPCPQSDAEEIVEAFGGARLRQHLVGLGEQPGDGFAVGEEVTVIVDEDGDAESLLQKGPQGYPASVGGQVAHVVDDPMGIIGRPGKGEADGRGFLAQLVRYGFESLHHAVETLVQVPGVSRQADRSDHFVLALHGGKYEIGAPGIQGQHDTLIVLVIHLQLPWLRRERPF